MNLTVMRAEKVKSIGELVNRLRHATREVPPEHADAARRAQNERQIGPDTADGVVGAMRLRWPEKRRKDAVLAIEYVMGASKEWWESATPAQQKDFVSSSLTWLESKYGAENVVYSVLHRDEQTPHLSVFVVPERDGKLQAKNYIGNSTQMRQDQTTYAQAIAHLGIERGVERSGAVHVKPSEFYAQLQKAERFRERDLQKFMLDLDVPAPKAMDRVNPEKYAQRVVAAVLAPFSKMLVAQQQKIILQQRRIDTLTETAKSIEKRYGTFFELLDAMPHPAQKKRAKRVLEALKGDVQAERNAEIAKANAVQAAHEENVRVLAEKLVLLEPSLTKEKAESRVDGWLTSGDPDDEKKLQELHTTVVPKSRVTSLFDMSRHPPTPAKKNDDYNPSF